MMVFEFPTLDDVPETFTGKARLIYERAIVHFLDGEAHHETEPAYYSDSTTQPGDYHTRWYHHGNLHCLDGPAVISCIEGRNIIEFYYVNHTPYTEKEYYDLIQVKYNPKLLSRVLESIEMLDSE